MNCRTLIATIFLIAQCFSQLALADSKAVFVIPDCGPYKFELPVPALNGTLVEGPRGGFYCTTNDFGGLDITKDGVIAELNARLSGSSVVAVKLSAYYYSNADFVRWLCSLPFSGSPSIDVFAQEVADREPHIEETTRLAFESCPTPPHFVRIGCMVFADDNDVAQDVIGPRCPAGAVNILHTKLAYFTLTDGRSVTLSGSGNFNKSLYANIEDWIISEDEIGGRLERQVACIFETLREVGGVPAVAPSFATRLYNTCLSRWLAGDSDGDLRLFMAPGSGDAYRRDMIKAATNAKSISIMAQALEDPDLIAAIAANSDAGVRVVLDDDWFWALRNKADFGKASWQKSEPLAALLQKPNVSVKYLETNHHGGGLSNTLHTRLLITQLEQATVFTGSAHFRKGSFNLNYEQLWKIERPSLTQAYQEFFDRVWARGVSSNDMLTIPVAPKIGN